MKNIEKIAIDSMLEKFQYDKSEMINAAISSKKDLEIAQANFKQAAGPLLNHAKELGALLIQDEVSEDASKYFEEKIAELVKIPFSLKSKS